MLHFFFFSFYCSFIDSLKIKKNVTEFLWIFRCSARQGNAVAIHADMALFLRKLTVLVGTDIKERVPSMKGDRWKAEYVGGQSGILTAGLQRRNVSFYWELKMSRKPAGKAGEAMRRAKVPGRTEARSEGRRDSMRRKGRHAEGTGRSQGCSQGFRCFSFFLVLGLHTALHPQAFFIITYFVLGGY